MTPETKTIKKDLTRFSLRKVSYIIIYGTVFIYPHTAFSGVFLYEKTMIEILIFTSFCLYATTRLDSKHRLLDKSPVDSPLIVLFFLIVIATVFAQCPAYAIEADLLFIAYICCFFVVLSQMKHKKQQIYLGYLIVFISLILCIKGLNSYVLMNERFEKLMRLRSTFGNSNQMGGFLSMTTPMLVGMMISAKQSRLILFILYFIFIIMFATLFLTYARGGWISTIISIGFIFLVQGLAKKIKLKRFFAIAITTSIVLLLFFLSSADLVKRFNTMTQNDIDSLLYGRLRAWQGTIEMIKANPANGVGPGNYTKAFTAFQPPGIQKPYIFAHNDYLHFISETGIFLIPIKIWLVCSLFIHGFKKIKYADRQIRGVTLGAMGGIVAILVYSISDFNLHIPANALLFTILTAIVAAPVSDKIKQNTLSTL